MDTTPGQRGKALELEGIRQPRVGTLQRSNREKRATGPSNLSSYYLGRTWTMLGPVNGCMQGLAVVVTARPRKKITAWCGNPAPGASPSANLSPLSWKGFAGPPRDGRKCADDRVRPSAGSLLGTKNTSWRVVRLSVSLISRFWDRRFLAVEILGGDPPP
jgi:hypothetical protein